MTSSAIMLNKRTVSFKLQAAIDSWRAKTLALTAVRSGMDVKAKAAHSFFPASQTQSPLMPT